MKELWWLLRGSLRVRLTCADPERTLRLLSGKIRLEQIIRSDPFTVEFLVSSDSMRTIGKAAERTGDRVEILERRGFPQRIRELCGVPVITGTVLLLLLLSFWIPGRILFFRVEGTERLSERVVLEKAAECGLSFGVSRSAVRSEQIKNRLLQALPELSWVGVNTQGCVATVTVKERQIPVEVTQLPPGNLVAAEDGIITSVTVIKGTPLCQVGDGVREGDILISGYTDLGLCTHVEPAQGEIYAMTRREITAVLPARTGLRSQNGELSRKIALLIGKYRINFYSDSGILHTGCGKMTQIRYLRLPGGWTLPLALVVEEYTGAAVSGTDRPEDEAREALERASLAQVQDRMIAGEILRSERKLESDGAVYRLISLCECHEMIGRRSSGILTEGDTNDDGQNGERGTG